jgi:hypothetical protein
LPSVKWVAEGVVLILGFIAIPASMAAVYEGIGDTVGLVQQTSVQRRIDARPVRLSATYTEDELVRSRSEYVYRLTYVAANQEFTTRQRSIPGDPHIGDAVCVEIDAENPQDARVCDTRGGLPAARTGLIEDGVVLVVAVVAMLFAFKPWEGRRRRQQPVRRKTASRRGRP